MPPTGGRQLKHHVRRLLASGDAATAIEAVLRLPGRRVINPILAHLYQLDEEIRWRAVALVGAVVARLAEDEPESARVVMRRLIWNLNDESGGIGWGSPEAMGEIMARSPRLAEEYAGILVSYLLPDENFLEFEALQCGVIWGLGRLAYRQPRLVVRAAAGLRTHLQAQDTVRRGFAAWAAGAFGGVSTGRFLVADLERLLADPAVVTLFRDLKLERVSIGRLAAASLARHHRSG